MRLPLRLCAALLSALSALSLGACSANPDSLLGGGGPGAGGGPGQDPTATPPGPQNNTPPALECTQKPQGRSYVGFDGQALEASRVNENIGVNRARLKPYAVLGGEYQRVLGLVPPSLAGAAGSFDAPPARWFAEAQHSGVSLAALFDISFEGCLTYTKTSPDYAAMPTAQSAQAVCTALMQKARSQSPSPAEIAGCVDLATTKLNDEPSAQRRWMYVCASILSSSNFLTF